MAIELTGRDGWQVAEIKCKKRAQMWLGFSPTSVLASCSVSQCTAFKALQLLRHCCNAIVGTLPQKYAPDQSGLCFSKTLRRTLDTGTSPPGKKLNHICALFLHLISGTCQPSRHPHHWGHHHQHFHQSKTNPFYLQVEENVVKVSRVFSQSLMFCN